MSSQLFRPVTLGRLALRNRIVASPMCQYSATDGSAGAWHRMHVGNLAASGVGLVLLEATAVLRDGRITPGCLGLYSDDNEHALRELIDGIRTFSDVPMGIQLAHAGRKASSALPWHGGQALPPDAGAWVTRAPSAVAHLEGEPLPQALELAELPDLRAAFVQAAQRAVRAGLQAVELHAAHGYLLHQFLSPLANRRSDAYGGSLRNRMRLPLEVFDAVRDALPPDIPLGIRVSATDWVDGGWDLAQTLELAAELRQRDCDWIDVSSGGISPLQKIDLKPGYQLPLAGAVRESSGLPVMGVGLITEPLQAEAALRDGQADLVALARALLWDPRWPWRAAVELGGEVQAPAQYWRCQPRGVTSVFAGARTGGR